ncbi:MAG: quaternary ammonium compound efflux SMR transporter SugE [Verrucomicrobiales bacterium]
MPWILLVLASLFEIAWAVGLKYTDGFSRPWPSLATIGALAISVGLLGVASKSLPIGTAYAVWTGIGAVGTVIFGIVLFGDSVSPPRLVCLGLIIAGILGLKMTSSAGTPAPAARRRPNRPPCGEPIALREVGSGVLLGAHAIPATQSVFPQLDQAPRRPPRGGDAKRAPGVEAFDDIDGEWVDVEEGEPEPMRAADPMGDADAGVPPDDGAESGGGDEFGDFADIAEEGEAIRPMDGDTSDPSDAEDGFDGDFEEAEDGGGSGGGDLGAAPASGRLAVVSLGAGGAGGLGSHL